MKKIRSKRQNQALLRRSRILGRMFASIPSAIFQGLYDGYGQPPTILEMLKVARQFAHKCPHCGGDMNTEPRLKKGKSNAKDTPTKGA
jgi:hypothetical protein